MFVQYHCHAGSISSPDHRDGAEAAQHGIRGVWWGRQVRRMLLCEWENVACGRQFASFQPLWRSFCCDLPLPPAAPGFASLRLSPLNRNARRSAFAAGILTDLKCGMSERSLRDCFLCEWEKVGCSWQCVSLQLLWKSFPVDSPSCRGLVLLLSVSHLSLMHALCLLFSDFLRWVSKNSSVKLFAVCRKAGKQHTLVRFFFYQICVLSKTAPQSEWAPESLFFFRFCWTWTKRYLITSQTRVKRVGQIHNWTILIPVHHPWCIRLTRLTLVCEVIRCRLVQVRQNLKKKKDFSGWRPTVAFLNLFLFHSLLRLTSFLSQKQKSPEDSPLHRPLMKSMGLMNPDYFVEQRQDVGHLTKKSTQCCTAHTELLVSKAFRSIARQTCTLRQCYDGHKNWSFVLLSPCASLTSNGAKSFADKAILCGV